MLNIPKQIGQQFEGDITSTNKHHESVQNVQFTIAIVFGLSTFPRLSTSPTQWCCMRMPNQWQPKYLGAHI